MGGSICESVRKSERESEPEGLDKIVCKSLGESGDSRVGLVCGSEVSWWGALVGVDGTDGGSRVERERSDDCSRLRVDALAMC